MYNPYDYENLAKRFPTVALVCGMLCSISAVVLASFLVGSPLTKASGLMDWTGIFPFILAQTFSVTAQIYEGLLFGYRNYPDWDNYKIDHVFYVFIFDICLTIHYNN